MPDHRAVQPTQATTLINEARSPHTTDLTERKAGTETNTGGTIATIAASAPDGSGVVTVTMTDGPAAKLFGRMVATQ